MDKTLHAEKQEGRTGYVGIASIIAAFAIALIALHIYSGKVINPEDFALGADNFHGFESWHGVRYTGSSIEEIDKVVTENARIAGPSTKLLAWFGNSQLHTINQFHSGDYLAPHWFRQLASCPNCVVPLGLSLPNVNLQEQFVLSQFVAQKMKPTALILEVVFDDLREDGLRGDFAKILTPALRASVARYDIGREILVAADAEMAKDNNAGGADNSGLDGALQRRVEDKLTDRIGDVWPLWRDRPMLRVAFLTDLYLLRNWAFRIKPTTVRKMIKPRFDRNMRAFDAILRDYRARGVPVVLYIAPIRQDMPLPYDAAEYAAWKGEVEALAKKYSATYVNLEKLVPGENWGLYNDDQIDFMHFRGPGHKLVAEALFPTIRPLLR